MARYLAWHVAVMTRTPAQLPDLAEIVGGADPVEKAQGDLALKRAAWIDWAIKRGIKVERHGR